MATRIVPKTELRDRIRQELASIGDDTLVVTEHGRPIVVAVSVARWNDLQEMLEDLEDAVAVYEHRAAGRRGRASEAVFASIESEEADVRGPDRAAG